MPKKARSSTDRRKAKVLIIQEFGVEVMPCSFCESKNFSCRAMPDSDENCLECTRRGISCDRSGVTLSAGMRIFPLVMLPFLLISLVASRITAEKRRLESEEDAAEERLLRAQAEMNQALAKLSRLRRQKRQLQKRGLEMLRKGKGSLDELEESDRQESEAVAVAHSWGAHGVIDWESSLLDFSVAADNVVSEVGISSDV